MNGTAPWLATDELCGGGRPGAHHTPACSVPGVLRLTPPCVEHRWPRWCTVVWFRGGGSLGSNLRGRSGHRLTIRSPPPHSPRNRRAFYLCGTKMSSFFAFFSSLIFWRFFCCQLFILFFERMNLLLLLNFLVAVLGLLLPQSPMSCENVMFK